MLDNDFSFHWDGGGRAFAHLHPVAFDITDAMSAPFDARLLLQTRTADDDLDPVDLIGQLGTLRIATGSKPEVRAFHGLVVAAEDRGTTAHGSLYELHLAPPLARAMHRKRSRIFVDKTLQQIIEAVLTGDPKMTAGESDASAPDDLRCAFAVPEEKFSWRLSELARLEDEKARPHCVQYEESDFAFVSRLLEEEGIAYHFEHTASQIVFVMSDTDAGRAPLTPFDALSPSTKGREIEAPRTGGRLRPTRVKLVEYNWQKPRLDMGAEAKGDSDDLFVQKYPGRFHESADQGGALATARLDRLHTEARFATAQSACRLLGAGTIFAVQHPIARLEGEYLVTKARLRGIALGELPAGHALRRELARDIEELGEAAFRAELELARRGTSDELAESRFRPARSTVKPRIAGTQTATVVDEPGARGAEIHVGGPEGNENGCVRLKFHWDTEADRHDKEPTSTWVRVSQLFAGAGGGSVAHPRVGTEVIVSYEDGDPDRPMVVGRVYNGVQPAAALGKGSATVTTWKSLSSPGGKVFNEFQFDDTAGEEKVNLTAGKDWNAQVNHQRNENIGHNSGSTVGANRSEVTKADRDTKVHGTNTETVDGAESITLNSSQTITVHGPQTETVDALQKVTAGTRSITVNGAQDVTVNGAHDLHVTGAETHTVDAAQTVTVGAAKSETIGGGLTLSVTGAMTVGVSGPHVRSSPVDITNAPTHVVSSSTTLISAGASATVESPLVNLTAGGLLTVSGAVVTIDGSGMVTITGAAVKIGGGSITIAADGALKLSGATVDIAGGSVKVN